MLTNIRIVLVRTFHSGNIGSVARAMKTMGLTDLVLVNPTDFSSSSGMLEAKKMARTAEDVLQNSSQVSSLYDALKDCQIVVASTARTRGYDLPYLDPEESAQKLLSGATKNKVALVFGPERMGLSNDDLQLCKYRVTIPTHPDYSSLNLAAAVQTLSYEVYKTFLKLSSSDSSIQSLQANEMDSRDLPDTHSLEQLYSHFEKTLGDTGFLIKNHPGELLQKIRQIFTRSELDKSELNILRGILASVDKYTDKNNTH
ncbi:MAG: RNA methyltransferase [Cocleimonas sp.]